jgi:hypothetical protein
MPTLEEIFSQQGDQRRDNKNKHRTHFQKRKTNFMRLISRSYPLVSSQKLEDM